MLESDAAIVVKWINDGSHLDSSYGNILVEISKLITSLNIVSVAHVPRVANTVAHGLAKNALKVADDLFWMEDFPSCVRSAIRLDSPV